MRAWFNGSQGDVSGAMQMEDQARLPSPTPSVAENAARLKLYEDFVEMYVAANPHKKRKGSSFKSILLLDSNIYYICKCLSFLTV